MLMICFAPSLVSLLLESDYIFYGRMDTCGVILRVKELFKEEKELLLGFNIFLPKGFEITIEGDQTLPDNVDFDEAISYMKKVKVDAPNLQ